MSDTESPEPISPIFEYSEEEILIQTEFKHKIRTARDEMQAKFDDLCNQLREEETRLLGKLNEIENEILKNFVLTSKALVEIDQAKKQMVDTFKTNLTNTLSKNILEMYENEIETIKKNSTIDKSTIQLKWNAIQFEKLCELKLITEKIVLKIIDTNPTQIEDSDLAPRIFHQQSIPPQQFSEILRPTDISSQTENPSKSRYHSILSPYPQRPTTSRDQPPIICPIPEKKGKYQSDKQWQCPYCSKYNVMKYSYCEECYKTPDTK